MDTSLNITHNISLHVWLMDMYSTWECMLAWDTALHTCTCISNVALPSYLFCFVVFIQGFVVGFSGSRIFCLLYFSMSLIDVPQVCKLHVLTVTLLSCVRCSFVPNLLQSASMIQYLERKNFRYI